MKRRTRREFLAAAGGSVAGVAIGSLWTPRARAQAALGETVVEIGTAAEVSPSAAGIGPEAHSALAELFEKQIRGGIHPGAQLTVLKGDHVVFDRWGGIAIKPTTPMRHDTKQLLFSSTKPLGAACTMMLVEQGDLALDEPVVRYWPGFSRGDAGKKAVTVGHVLRHQGGFPTGPRDFHYEDFADSAAAMRAMERVKLAWEPGSRFQYHPLNYGWVLNELIRRVSGMPPERFMKRRLFDPLGCVNASLGVPPDELDEISFIYRVTDRNHPIEIWNSPAVRMSPCCAASGHMPAADLARFYRMMGRGGIAMNGERLLKSETVELMTRAGTIEKTGEPSPYGLGFFLRRNEDDSVYFGHGGSSSSFGRCDPALQLSAAFITNGHQENETHRRRMSEIWSAIRALAV